MPPRSSPTRRARTLVFYRDRSQYLERWPELPIVSERRFSFLLYPLSGGFTRSPLRPAFLHRPLGVVERILQPVAPRLPFRCLVSSSDGSSARLEERNGVERGADVVPWDQLGLQRSKPFLPRVVLE